MTVVLDSNVWISALHFRGSPLAVLRNVYAWDRIAYCAEIKTEVQKTLVNRLRWTPRNALIAMEQYLDLAVEIPITGAVSGVCRDPKDDMILECAFSSQAELIVTGDKDLLVLEDYSGIRILTAHDYLISLAV